MRAFITLFLLFSRVVLHAQPSNLFFTNFGTDDGLPNSGVTKVYQDEKGFIWLATYGGLAKFDGHEFRPVPLQVDSLGNALSLPLSDMLPDQMGNLWLATEEGRLFTMNLETEIGRPDTLFQNAGTNLAQEGTNCLFITEDHWLFTGTETGLRGIHLKTKEAKTLLSPAEGWPSVKVVDINADQKGDLWVSSSGNGLFRVSSNGDVENYTTKGENGVFLASDDLKEIWISGNGSIWFGSHRGGLQSFDPISRKIKVFKPGGDLVPDFPTPEAFSVAGDGKGNVWVGSWGGGLVVLDTTTLKFVHLDFEQDAPNGVIDDVVYTIFRDRDDNMWLGGYYMGLGFYNPDLSLVTRLEHSNQSDPALSGNNVSSILKDTTGHLWIGTYGSFLNRYDPITGENKYFGGGSKGLPNHAVWSMWLAGGQDLWVGTSGGISLYDPSSETFTTYQHDPNDSNSISIDNIFTINEGPAGNLWLGTWYGGLNKFDHVTKKATRFFHQKDNLASLPSNNIKHLLPGPDGKLWIGTDEGLARMDFETEEIERIVTPEFSSQSITALYQYHPDTMLIATRSGNFQFVFSADSLSPMSLSHGFSNFLINGFLEDGQGNLWLATETGIFCYIKASNQILKFGKKDGLISEDTKERTFIKDESGTFYLGSIDGLSIFDPKDLLLKVNRPTETILTDFLLFNRPYKPSKEGEAGRMIAYQEEIHLSHKDYLFAFEFANLNFGYEENVTYAYKLEGFHHDWIYTSPKDRKAVLTNVPDGAYTFMVKSTNPYGLWNSPPASIKVIVDPPWWETPLAEFIFLCLVILVIFLVINLRTANIRRQKKELVRLVRDGTAEIREKNITLAAQKDEIEAQAYSLKTKNKKLEELGVFKENLTHMVVHDLKNPLNALKNVASNKSSESALARVKNLARQMEVLVLNILDIQKFEEASFDLNLAIFEPCQMVNGAVEETIFLIEEKYIQLELDCAKEVKVKVDGDLIRRVLVNLLTNAIKYSPHGGAIKVYSEIEGENIKISVQDFGIGIPADMQQKVFEKYGQVSKHKGKFPRSTGLGLTFCKFAIEAMGGEIGLVSKEGSGSTFWVRLPCKLGSSHQAGEVSKLHVGRHSHAPDPSDFEQLAPYLEKLRALEVYYSSLVEAVVLELERLDLKPKSLLWKKALEKSIFNVDQQQFQHLIEIASMPDEQVFED